MPTTQTILALSTWILFAGMLILWTLMPPADNNAMLNALLGLLAAAATSVTQYYFGSSSGSKQKDDTLAEIATKATPDADSPEEGDPH